MKIFLEVVRPSSSTSSTSQTDFRIRYRNYIPHQREQTHNTPLPLFRRSTTSLSDIRHRFLVSSSFYVYKRLTKTKGSYHEYGSPEYNSYIPEEKRTPGSRAVIVIDIHKVGTVSLPTSSLPLYIPLFLSPSAPPSPSSSSPPITSFS